MDGGGALRAGGEPVAGGRALDVEADVQNVPVLDEVALAFEALQPAPGVKLMSRHAPTRAPQMESGTRQA